MTISISPPAVLPGQKAAITYNGGNLQILSSPVLHQSDWQPLRRNQGKQGVVLEFLPDVGGQWLLGILDGTGKVADSLTVSVPSQLTTQDLRVGSNRYSLLMYMLGDVVIDTSSYGVPSPSFIVPSTGNGAATDPRVPVGGAVYTISMLQLDSRVRSALGNMVGMNGSQVTDYISNSVTFTAPSGVTANSLFVVSGPDGSARVGSTVAGAQRLTGSTYTFYPDLPGGYGFATSEGGEVVTTATTPNRLGLTIAAAIASPQAPSTENSGAVYLGLRAGFSVA